MDFETLKSHMKYCLKYLIILNSVLRLLYISECNSSMIHCLGPTNESLEITGNIPFY